MKSIITAVCLSGILLISILIIGCGEKVSIEKLSSLPPSDTTQPDQQIDNAQIQLTNGPVITAIIKAGRIKQYGQSLYLADSNLIIHFLNREGDTVLVLTSNYGRIYPQTNDMEASGDVVVTNRDTLILYTQSLKWDNQRQVIHTSDKVRIERGKDYLLGKEFEATSDLKKYTIKHVYISTFQDLNRIY